LFWIHLLVINETTCMRVRLIKLPSWPLLEERGRTGCREGIEKTLVAIFMFD
jgi:hypothetical protein